MKKIVRRTNLPLAPNKLLVNIPFQLKLLIFILFPLAFSCEQDDPYADQLSEAEIEALFDNNRMIEGTGTLNLKGEEIEISSYEIERRNARFLPSGKTGFTLEITGIHPDDKFYFFSDSMITNSGIYSFEAVSGSGALNLAKSPPCFDSYYSSKGSISIEFTQTNIEVSIFYLGDYIERLALSQGCSGRLVSSASHEVELELNFPL